VRSGLGQDDRGEGWVMSEPLTDTDRNKAGMLVSEAIVEHEEIVADQSSLDRAIRAGLTRTLRRAAVLLCVLQGQDQGPFVTSCPHEPLTDDH